MKGTNIHFVILAIGSAFFVYKFSEVSASGTGDRALLEIWAIARRLALLSYYVVFVALVIGHGVLGGSGASK